MFSSELDTVRIADEKQLTLVEAFLMRAALSGNPAVLSPNQAIDSAAIQAIAAGNGHNSQNHFIRAVKKGIVRVSLPGTATNLLDHCLSSINRSKENPSNEFRFSSLKFLYTDGNGENSYDYAFRRQILDYMSTELSHAHQRNRVPAPFPVSLPPEQQEMILRYIHVMVELNHAIRYYDQYVYQKKLYPAMVSQALAARLETVPPRTALSELIQRMLPACSDPSGSMYRSYYYGLCDRYLYEFGAEAVREVREILDICYNKLIAISMHQQAELNIAPDFAETATLQASEEDVFQTLFTGSRRVDNATEKLDWEMLVEIYDEITALREQKNLTWQEALETFYARQTSVPFVLGTRYALITSLTIALSTVPVVGTLANKAVSEILINALFGEMETALKKPSVQDIVSCGIKAYKQVQMMDIIICTDPRLNNGRNQQHDR